MGDHTRVLSITTLSPNRHDLTLTNKVVVKVFLTDTYVFSTEDYEELRGRHPEVTAIVSASNWNHFTGDGVRAGAADEVAMYTIGELMSDLHTLAKRENRASRRTFPEAR